MRETVRAASWGVNEPREGPRRHMSSYIGKSIPRLEDLRLVAGKGRYTDDLAPSDASWAYVLRSPHPHASVRAIRTERARGFSGVLAVLTAADATADGLKPIPHLANAADAVDPTRPTFVNGPHVVYETPQPVLATNWVRHVGEAVAAVIAETLAQAKDAAEAIEVDYEVLAGRRHHRCLVGGRRAAAVA